MQDVLDDTNCTPIFEIDESTGEAAIYLGTSTHWTADQNEIAQIPVLENQRYNRRNNMESARIPLYAHQCIRGVQSTAAARKE